jgi:hypothetical protein
MADSDWLSPLLTHPQLAALRVLRDRPDIEAPAVIAAAGCVWADLYILADYGLIDPGYGRLVPKRTHPTLTASGRAALRPGGKNAS